MVKLGKVQIEKYLKISDINLYRKIVTKGTLIKIDTENNKEVYFLVCDDFDFIKDGEEIPYYDAKQEGNEIIFHRRK